LPGTGEDPKAPVYRDGKLVTTLQGPTLVDDFNAMIDEYVKTHYGKEPVS
jgi:(E)-4-hydroxy-3-methylbut-2-enyl-diphosphate synthase